MPGSSALPYLERLSNGCTHLLVDGRPFLMRAAELNNSSLSSSRYMDEVWPRLVQNNVNTVLGAVSWEQLEPREGHFDYENLDAIVKSAGSNGLRLVLLWFGAFKNALSTYVPAWVKRDPKRFPRARIIDPKSASGISITEAVSLFGQNIVFADARAFGRLMAHLREVDHDHTVIMVQVENEIGLLGDSRDRCAEAEAAYSSVVPTELLQTLQSLTDAGTSKLGNNLQRFFGVSLKTGMSWEKTFGADPEANQLFMAYHFAKYVEQIASAGKREHPLPMFVNAWLPVEQDPSDPSTIHPFFVGGGQEPGAYPSGGPNQHVMDIWRCFAQSIDFLSPDIYASPYEATCATFRHRGQPLFIPEQRRDDYGARRMWVAIGTYQALGVSPFGIDSADPATSPFNKHYALLQQVSPLIVSARTDSLPTFGFYFDSYDKGVQDPSPVQATQMGRWSLRIERAFVFGHPGPGYGLVIQLGPDRFRLIGEGFRVSFTSTLPEATFSGILSFEEKEFVPGSDELRTLRLLNGDETLGGKFANMPGADPDYGSFFICISIPARTRIAECEVFHLTE